MSGQQASITVVADGPLLVQGSFVVLDDEGAQIETPTSVALCRCGRSATKPLCDGSHKAGRRTE